MEHIWKKAGAVLGNHLTGKEALTEAAVKELTAAMDEDYAAAKAEMEQKAADLLETVTALQGDKDALEAEKAGLGQKISDLESEKSALQAKLDEYEPLKAQMEAYKEQVKGTKTGDSKTEAKTEEEESYEAKLAENERLKSEYKYSAAGL
jgi:chromosome segregation ATPase